MLDVTRNNANYRLHEERVIDTLLLFDPWVNAFGVREWLGDLASFRESFSEVESMDSPGRFAAAKGWLAAYYPVEQFPVYCGSDESEFKERVRFHALVCRQFVVENSWTVDSPASPFCAMTF